MDKRKPFYALDENRINQLKKRVENSGFSKEFWSKVLLEDYNINTNTRSINNDYAQIYENLYALEKIKESPLLSVPTQLFIQNNKDYELFLSLIDNNVDEFRALLEKNHYNNDELKAFQELAAFFGSLEILACIPNLPFDNNTLNMAILSGKYTSMRLRYFTKYCMPAYDSINFAIHSLNLGLLQELIEVYNLKPSSDNLVVAAATGDRDIFQFLLSKGIKPKGKLVLETALKHNQEIAELIIHHFNTDNQNTI
ncbi:hypothetical protein [Legionella tucsonensis]|uniref:Ankyrin repeats (3 copies) n=1 Tax=Legionella tucsonensis TaxID=40335 RepID=A0A0W0ZSF3_9GAMM|nr:hypothetical protein [Legionella tucsonensis]KTD71886.1 hypothetical protein Ltuc_2492 [Legionella tucsonensis]